MDFQDDESVDLGSDSGLPTITEEFRAKRKDAVKQTLRLVAEWNEKTSFEPQEILEAENQIFWKDFGKYMKRRNQILDRKYDSDGNTVKDSEVKMDTDSDGADKRSENEDRLASENLESSVSEHSNEDGNGEESSAVAVMRGTSRGEDKSKAKKVIKGLTIGNKDEKKRYSGSLSATSKKAKGKRAIPQVSPLRISARKRKLSVAESASPKASMPDSVMERVDKSRFQLGNAMLRKIGAKLPKDTKQHLGHDSLLLGLLGGEDNQDDFLTEEVDAATFVKQHQEKKKRLRKSAVEQKKELGDVKEVPVDERLSDQALLDIGLEKLTRKERHKKANYCWTFRGFLKEAYWHLADKKDNKGEHIWNNSTLKPMLREDLEQFRKRRDPSSSTVFGASGVRQRAPKTTKDAHDPHTGRFKKVTPAEKQISEQHQDNLIYQRILEGSG